MITYYMTAKNSGTIGYWERCKSTTLSSAKREATKAYGDGYIDDRLLIALGNADTEPRDIILIIASKSNAAGKRWINYN